jgi:copper homeostasis protein (lipoprotein)
VTGSLRLTGRSISLGEEAVTMMACVGGMEYELESKKALGNAKSWQITGQHLELYDENGAAVARFEARAMP